MKTSSDASSPEPGTPEILTPSGELLRPPRKTWAQKAELSTQGLRLAVLALFLLVWHLVVVSGLIQPAFAATPLETFTRLVQFPFEPLFWTDLIVTLREALGGWAIGAVLGLTVGLILGRWRGGLKVMGPYLTFVNAVPKIALAPIFILWFGIGETSKVVMAALVVFFIVQVPTTAAVSMTNPDLDTVATTMGANQRQRFFKVYLPGILPSVFGALRLGSVYALLTVVFTEFLAARQGLGQRLITATNQFSMDEGFALMIVLAFLALTLNGVIGIVERRVLRWRDTAGRGAVVSL